jgi:XTP/dITP diphosphohydrolase
MAKAPPLVNNAAMTTVLIATRNAHKAGEISAILGDAFTCLTLNDFPAAPAIPETADTFAGNAALKALGLARWLRSAKPKLDASTLFILADDSGLEVDALDGRPGVHSARFAAMDSGQAGNSPDADNNLKLLRLLKDVPTEKRTARFRCVLSLLEADLASNTSHLKAFEGACEGQISFTPSGAGGFGYDPLFVPSGFDKSFAELGADEKNKLSHRAKALAKLAGYLANKPSR